MGFPTFEDSLKDYDKMELEIKENKNKLEAAESDKKRIIDSIETTLTTAMTSIESFIKCQVDMRKTYNINDYITKEGFNFVSDNSRYVYKFSYPYEYMFEKDKLNNFNESLITYYIVNNDTPSTHTAHQDIKRQLIDESDKLNLIIHPPVNFINKYFIYSDYDKIIGNTIYKDTLMKMFKDAHEEEKSKDYIKQIIGQEYYNKNEVTRYTWIVDGVQWEVSEYDFEKIDKKLLPAKVEKKTQTIYSWSDENYVSHEILTLPQTKSILNEIAEIVNA